MTVLCLLGIARTAKARSGIAVLRLSSDSLVFLTNNGAADEEPEWPPDGRSILFQHEADGNTDVYVMKADVPERVGLTDHPARDGWPDWSPGGTAIVTQAGRVETPGRGPHTR